MRLFCKAGILFVGNDKQLDLTEIGKSQMVYPPYSLQDVFLCLTMVNEKVLKQSF